MMTAEQYAALSGRGQPAPGCAYPSGADAYSSIAARASQIDQEDLRRQALQATELLREHGRTAYEGSKALLRGAHVINQYVSLAAGGCVCFSSAVAAMEMFGLVGENPWRALFGMLTQAYIFLFGLGIIVLEVPIVEKTKPVLAFKLWVDHWLRAFSRLTARGLVYFVNGVLIVDAQEGYSELGEFCGYILFAAGIFSIAVGYLTTQDVLRLKSNVRTQLDNNGQLLTAVDIFKAADTDHDGKLSKSEVLTMVKTQNPKMSELQVDALYISLDTNRDGKVSLEEFLVWYDRTDFSAEDLV